MVASLCKLENVVAANLAWSIRKWLPANCSTEKYLPRHWIAEAHWPRSLGFTAVLQGAARLPDSAPILPRGDERLEDAKLDPSANHIASAAGVHPAMEQ